MAGQLHLYSYNKLEEFWWSSLWTFMLYQGFGWLPIIVHLPKGHNVLTMQGNAVIFLGAWQAQLIYWPYICRSHLLASFCRLRENTYISITRHQMTSLLFIPSRMDHSTTQAKGFVSIHTILSTNQLARIPNSYNFVLLHNIWFFFKILSGQSSRIESVLMVMPSGHY